MVRVERGALVRGLDYCKGLWCAAAQLNHMDVNSVSCSWLNIAKKTALKTCALGPPGACS